MSDVLHKGIEWRRTFTATDDDTGGASDLSGMAGTDITLEIRRHSSDASNLLTYTLADELVLTGDGSGGVFTIALPGVDSEGLATANHVYRILILEQVALDWRKLTVRP